MPLDLSRRARNLKPSATFRLARRARELQAEGKDVLSFGLGEPDFDTPPAAREAAHRAIDEGKTHYTTNEGIEPLRNAIADHFERTQGVRYDPASEIMVTAGAKQALAHAMFALIDDGDEVLVPAPYWLSYPEQVTLAGGVLVPVPTRADEGFRPDAAAIAAAVTTRTKMLILNSPNNPTGAVLDEERLAAIAAVCVERDLIVLADEIYGALVYGGATHRSIAAAEGMRERTIVCQGFSKSFAMTGWRLGYALAPAEVLGAMARIQSHTTSNANSIAQYAATTALRECADDVEAMRRQFEARRTVVHEQLSAIDGLSVPTPEGAFYVFPTIGTLFGRKTPTGRTIDGSTAFCEALLDEALVSVIPGIEFGEDRCFRLSYAASTENLLEGCARIAKFVTALA